MSADPVVANHVRRRLAERRRSPFAPVLVAASVASAMVIATALWPQREPAAPANAELAVNAIVPMASLRVPTLSASPRLPQALTRSSGPLVEGGALPHGERAPSALPPEIAVAVANVGLESGPPAPLTVADVIIAPVTRQDAAAIAPLDVAPLEVPELDTTYESKEPR